MQFDSLLIQVTTLDSGISSAMATLPWLRIVLYCRASLFIKFEGNSIGGHNADSQPPYYSCSGMIPAATTGRSPKTLIGSKLQRECLGNGVRHTAISLFVQE